MAINLVKPRVKGENRGLEDLRDPIFGMLEVVAARTDLKGLVSSIQVDEVSSVVLK